MQHAPIKPETVEQAAARRDAVKRGLNLSPSTPYPNAHLSNADRLARTIALLNADADVQRAHRAAKGRAV